MGDSPDRRLGVPPVACRHETSRGEPSIRAKPPWGAEATSGDTRFRPPRRVLHIERDTFLAALIHATLEDAGFGVDSYPSADAALAAVPAAAYDVCLLEGDFPALAAEPQPRPPQRWLVAHRSLCSPTSVKPESTLACRRCQSRSATCTRRGCGVCSSQQAPRSMIVDDDQVEALACRQHERHADRWWQVSETVIVVQLRRLEWLCARRIADGEYSQAADVGCRD